MKIATLHQVQGRIQGGGPGGPGPPLSENLGIDFYSGFRKKIQVYTFIVASEKRNPGIDFHSGSRDPKKSRHRLL